MLRITVRDQGAEWTLQLEGRLVGALAGEAERAWREAPVSRQPVAVDLRGVTAIDAAGQRLLEKMHSSGARLIAKGVAMKALVDEITSTFAAK
jgi:anti-anti-sigma regulatory factor